MTLALSATALTLSLPRAHQALKKNDDNFFNLFSFYFPFLLFLFLFFLFASCDLGFCKNLRKDKWIEATQ